MAYYVGQDANNLVLNHYGVLGMKWGIRRYQNKDGTLTQAGKDRYGTAENMAKVRKEESRTRTKNVAKAVGKAALKTAVGLTASYLIGINGPLVKAGVNFAEEIFRYSVPVSDAIRGIERNRRLNEIMDNSLHLRW